MTPALKDSLRKHAVPILCLVLAPIIVAIIHDDWLFTPIDYLDPWYNVGFFMDYFDPTFMPGHYKESRLSWLAPAWLVYKTMSPLAANFVLHLGPLIGTVLLVYLTLNRLVSRNAAFLAAALLCAYYPFHNSGGWDYQTAPSGLYYALTLYLLTRGAQSLRPGPWLVGAGAAYAGAFHADILFVNMAPVLAAHYLVVAGRRPTVKQLATVAGWVVLGFVILTQVLSAIAWSAGRSPMFYKPIIDIVFSYTMAPHQHMAQWWLPTSSGWFLDSGHIRYLIVLAGIALGGLVWLAAWALRLRGPARAVQLDGPILIRVMLIGQFVFLFLLWVLWQSLGHVALQPDYFAYPIIIPAFVALGALIGTARPRELILLGVVVAAVMLSSLTKPADVALINVDTAYWLVIGFIAAAIAVGAFLPKAKAAAVVLAAGVFLVGYQSMWSATSWSELRRVAGDCSNPHNNFVEIVRMHKLLRDNTGTQHTWLWNGPATPVDSMCNIPLDGFRWALLSTGISPLGVGREPSAELLPDSEVAAVPKNDRIVAMVRDRTELAPLVARFARGGRELAVDSEQQIKFDGRFAIVVIYRLKS